MILNQILQELSIHKSKRQVFIPSIWKGESSKKPIEVDYADFLKGKIKEIIDHDTRTGFGASAEWTKQALVYNIFIRYFSAYDHDQDGSIGKE